MSTASSPTRLGRDVHAAAKVAAEMTGRTVAQQLTHWARLGSEVEARWLLELRHRRVAVDELLAGRDYDDLTSDEQALARTMWDEDMDARVIAADVTGDKHAAGWPVITLDEDGNVVRHHPDGTVELL